MAKHPKPQSKKGRVVARKKATKRVGVMKQILKSDPWGSRRN